MRRVLHRLRPEPAVLAAVRRARARGVRTAMLSNSFGLGPCNVYRDLDVLGLFDVVVLSELEGLRKPASDIYRRTCRRLGLTAEHLLFVDDHEVNLAPAEKPVMATLLHTDADATGRSPRRAVRPAKGADLADEVAVRPRRPGRSGAVRAESPRGPLRNVRRCCRMFRRSKGSGGQDGAATWPGEVAPDLVCRGRVPPPDQLPGV
ncbi:HAD-IA family hydrolase [Streptomyces sp. NPDC006335]|uniref:HAD-IA family hydrolase n=1 Tax=Streptomyces sp. NPDC006335 TaxID=3156895 RepID=UPI0033ADB24B